MEEEVRQRELQRIVRRRRSSPPCARCCAVIVSPALPSIAARGTASRNARVRAIRSCRSAKLVSSSANGHVLHPADPHRRELRRVARPLHLPGQRQHVRRQPRLAAARPPAIPSASACASPFSSSAASRSEPAQQHRHRDVVERDRHRRSSPDPALQDTFPPAPASTRRHGRVSTEPCCDATCVPTPPHPAAGPLASRPADRLSPGLSATQGAPMARILITSALPYINGVKHLGNLVGSQLPSDVYARYCRARGHEVLLICATDEHGTPGRARRRRGRRAGGRLLRPALAGAEGPRRRLPPLLRPLRPLVEPGEPRPHPAFRRPARRRRPDLRGDRAADLLPRRRPLPARPLRRGHLPQLRLPARPRRPVRELHQAARPHRPHRAPLGDLRLDRPRDPRDPPPLPPPEPAARRAPRAGS